MKIGEKTEFRSKNLYFGFKKILYFRFGKENNLDQKPYRADDFASLLRSMLDARFMRRRPSTPPPPYEDKEKNDFAKTVDQLIDSDPNFITKSLTPKIVIRNNNE